jgi:peptidoglycan/LPS O-acetylase OafA/YrhL
MATTPHRFVVLDSLRGICALMIALYHLKAYSIFKQIPFFTNAYLFVDFFFVLSGFVIAINYQTRLTSGFGIKKFILLRFGRLYPLYLVVLVCFFIREALIGGPTAFATPEKSLDTMLTDVFLIQCFGLYSFLSWNWPGWSIAAEFWTCVLFALVATFWPQRIVAILSAASIFALYIIASQTNAGINVTYNFGMLRSIIGFSTGVVVFAIWEKTNGYQVEERLAFVIEMFCVISVVVFVSIVAQSNYSLFAPLVFAIVVLVFAKERGAISNFLKHRFFNMLGLLSYSIYLVHLFVNGMMVRAVSGIELLSGHQFITKVSNEDKVIDYLGVNLTQANIWVPVYLILVVGVAAFTYRYVEVPSRLWFRKQAQVGRP